VIVAVQVRKKITHKKRRKECENAFPKQVFRRKMTNRSGKRKVEKRAKKKDKLQGGDKPVLGGFHVKTHLRPREIAESNKWKKGRIKSTKRKRGWPRV